MKPILHEADMMEKAARAIPGTRSALRIPPEDNTVTHV